MKYFLQSFNYIINRIKSVLRLLPFLQKQWRTQDALLTSGRNQDALLSAIIIDSFFEITSKSASSLSKSKAAFAQKKVVWAVD